MAQNQTDNFVLHISRCRRLVVALDSEGSLHVQRADHLTRKDR
jgi:hypothetical protein